MILENQRLILITKRFPYYNTESFLESEIKILSSHFSDILIFPLEKSMNPRSLPKNITVSDSLVLKKNEKIIQAVFTVFSRAFYKGFYLHRKIISSPKDIIFLLKFISRSILLKKRVQKHVLKFNNSIIYTYWFNDVTFSLAKMREEGILSNVKIVSRAHRFDLYEGKNEIYNFWPYRYYTLKTIDKLFAISEDGKRFIENKYRNKFNIQVSRLGVFDNQIISKSSIDQLNVVSAAWISERKRIYLILESLEALSNNNPLLSIYWTHFGDGPLFNKIESQIKKNNYPNLRIKLAGKTPNEEIIKFYQNNAIDLFMNLSSSEGIPVSIMEAQSFGIPVIATNVGATSEIVNERVGYLLKSNPTIEEVCSGIENILKRRINKSVIKSEWLRKFDADKNYNDFARSLKEII